MTDVLPKGSCIGIEMVVALPCDTSRKHIDEWVSFRTGAVATMSGDNPLRDHDLTAVCRPTLTDMKMRRA